MTHVRIGLVVPSSNVTVETEMPALLARHPSARFSFHSSRMRMRAVILSVCARESTARARAAATTGIRLAPLG
jgi:maleate isomerase